MMTSGTRPLAGPGNWIGLAVSPRPGQPRPMESGTFALVTLPTSPFWARLYTGLFLNMLPGNQ